MRWQFSILKHPLTTSSHAHSFRPSLPEKIRSERLDDTLHLLDKIQQRWENRLTLENLDLSEDYKEGRVEFLAECDLIPSSQVRASHDSGKVATPLTLKICSSERKRFLADNYVEPLDVSNRERWNEEFMFVPDLKIVQSSQHGSLSSVVGFQFPKHAHDVSGRAPLGSGPLYFAFKVGFEAFPIPAVREIRFLSIAAVNSDRLDGKMIQRAPKVMYRIAYWASELKRESCWQEDHFYLPTIKIRGEEEGLAAALEIFADNRLRLKKVAFGPFDL